MTDWINTLLQGILLGGLYAMFAAGLSLSFGVMRMINLAHGDMIVFGSYAILVACVTLGLPLLAGIVLAVPAVALLGYVTQRWVFNRALGHDTMRPLVLTFGLSIIIRNALQMVFAADVRGMDIGTLGTATWDVGHGMVIGVLPALVMVAGVACIAAVQGLFRHSRIGRAFRATSDDPATAELMGIDRHHIYAQAMAVASALVALAGAFLVMRTTVSPADGPLRLLSSFEAVIMGGLGSIWGTLAGGVVLGVAQTVGARLDPSWGVLCGHLAFLVVLVVRPQGMFPRTRGS